MARRRAPAQVAAPGGVRGALLERFEELDARPWVRTDRYRRRIEALQDGQPLVVPCWEIPAPHRSRHHTGHDVVRVVADGGLILVDPVHGVDGTVVFEPARGQHSRWDPGLTRL